MVRAGLEVRLFGPEDEMGCRFLRDHVREGVAREIHVLAKRLDFLNRRMVCVELPGLSVGVGGTTLQFELDLKGSLSILVDQDDVECRWILVFDRRIAS